jgi:hypothetical protein
MNRPDDLGPRGRFLWDSVTEAHELDATQLIQLEDACNAADEVARMTEMLAEGHDSKLQSDLNATRNLVKQLIAALRLPDQFGKRPQVRGTARGAVAPQQPGGKVSSLDRARSRKSA